MVYKWKTTGLYKVDPNIAGAEIERCRNDGDVILPSAVVERAADVENPLHDCFEWDNGKAANKWREQQARVLIANVLTVVEAKSEEAKPTVVRAFVNISDGGERGYKEVNKVLLNDADRQYMLDRALGELRSFEVKYQTLSELNTVFAAIREVLV